MERSVQSPPRYDAIAAWYLPWVGPSAGLVCDPAMGMVPEDLAGQRWLDVACGTGRTSRELARRGAAVVGVDLSAELVAAARAEEETEAPGITYLVADITVPDDWWDGQAFDGATCEMAFMDIDDLAGAVEAVATVLRPGGVFKVSMVNPCFPGNDAGLSSWPPGEGYQAEGYWTSPLHNPDGVRTKVGSNHRTLATYLNTFLDAGLVLERVQESQAEVPTLLVLAFRREGTL